MDKNYKKYRNNQTHAINQEPMKPIDEQNENNVRMYANGKLQLELILVRCVSVCVCVCVCVCECECVHKCVKKN
jgi:hypothetical protein